jgi:hypothetical protein
MPVKIAISKQGKILKIQTVDSDSYCTCAALQTGHEVPEAVMEWSLDHGYECIQLDAETPVFGWQDREKEGLPRIMEAFQTQMWSTMVKNGTLVPVFAYLCQLVTDHGCSGLQIPVNRSL